MIKSYAIYKKLNGEITKICSCTSEEILLNTKTDEDYIEINDYSINDVTHYVKSGIITACPTMDVLLDKNTIIGDGNDKATISNCPVNAEVFMNDVSIGLVDTDGLVEITSDIQKEINIRIKLFPYLTWTGVINAT